MGFDRDYAEVPITWERGLVEVVEDSMLPPGAAARLRNWAADPSGNVRTRVGWRKGATTGTPGTRKGQGIGHVVAPRRPQIIQKTSGISTFGATPKSASATWGVATTAGNLLVALVAVVQDSLNPDLPTITPPAGGWTLAKVHGANAAFQTKQHAWIYYIENAASQSGAKSWQASFLNGGSAAVSVQMFEVSNIVASGALDRVGATVDDATSTTARVSIASDITGTTADAGTEIISTRTAHGFSVGDAIRFFVFPNGVLPTGLAIDTTYYVLTVNTSTSFTVTTTSTGTSALNITGTGDTDSWGVGKWPRITPVGISFAIISAHNSADVSATSSSGFTLEVEQYLDFTSDDLNAFGYSKVYQNPIEYDDLVATLSSASMTTSVMANFKATGFTTLDAYYVVAHNATTGFGIYYIDRDNLVAGTGAFTLLETVTCDPLTNLVAFTAGNEKLFYTHPGFSATRSWSGRSASVPVALASAPVGRAIAYHKNRLWIAGTTNEPWKLHFSELGDHTIWDSGTATYINVGVGDGEPIEDIAQFNDGLLIAKQNSLWFLSGDDVDDFVLTKMDIGGGAPGRCIAPSPYGAIIAGRKNVWRYTGGVTVSMISGPIRDSYGMTGSWMSATYIDEKCYIDDQGSGTVWSVDFGNGGTWAEEILGSASTEGPAVIFSHADRNLFAPRAATIGSLLSYRLLPGSPRAKDFDTLSETFEAWSPEMWLTGPQEKQTPRYLFLKLRQRGAASGANTGLTVTPYYDGVAGTAQVVPPLAAAGMIWVRLGLGQYSGVSSFQLRFSQTLPSTEATLMDIEECTVGFNVEHVV